MKRTRKRKGGGWFDWIWKKPKTTLTKEDEKELQRMTKERTRPSIDVRTGEYRAVALRKRIPVGEPGWNKGGRRRSRRKRRRSRRGGKWCKCSDLEKICEKREKRQKHSQDSAQKYKERKRRPPMSPGIVYRVVVPERSRKNSPRLQREMSEGSIYPRLGGRRRRTRRRKKRRRKRRKTRRKRRRRRTRRKRGGAPKWLDGVDKEYIFKDGGTWFLLRDKNAKNSARPANTYPHLHGGPNWLNCTFAKGDHDEIWSVGMEGYKKGSLDDLKKNIAGNGPKPLGLNASARVEWKKVVTNMKALGAGGGGGGSGVRSSSPRHRGGPVAMSFKPVTEGEILGKKARTITPPSPFVQEQLKLQREVKKAEVAKKREEDDLALAIKLSKQRISPLNVRTELIKRGWNEKDVDWSMKRSSTIEGCEKELWTSRRKPADPLGAANMKDAREEARREQQRLHPSKSRFGFAASDPEPAAAASASPKSAMKINKKKTADLHSALGEGFFK